MKPSTRNAIKTYGTSMPFALVYHNEFPTDTIYNELNKAITVDDLHEMAIFGKMISKIERIIGVEDSIVRERTFEIIADVYGYDFNELYNLWLAS